MMNSFAMPLKTLDILLSANRNKAEIIENGIKMNKMTMMEYKILLDMSIFSFEFYYGSKMQGLSYLGLKAM